MIKLHHAHSARECCAKPRVCSAGVHPIQPNHHSYTPQLALQMETDCCVQANGQVENSQWLSCRLSCTRRLQCPPTPPASRRLLRSVLLLPHGQCEFNQDANCRPQHTYTQSQSTRNTHDAMTREDIRHNHPPTYCRAMHPHSRSTVPRPEPTESSNSKERM